MGHRRLTDEQRQRIVELLHTSATHREIAERAGVHRDTVKLIAVANHIRRKHGPRPLPVPVHAAIVAYEQQDLPIVEVARRLRMRRQRVATAMAKAGLRKRPTNQSRKASLSDLLRLRRAGLSLAEIARRVGLHRSTVRTRFERFDAKRSVRPAAVSA